MNRKPEAVVPLIRCGDWMGRAAAGFVILGALGSAVAAVVVDLL